MNDRGKRVLIVDDNVALARVTQFTLDGAGFETETAFNGRLALEAAARTQFDIVITDQQMPEMTGIELCRALRATPNYATCPIILLTAKGLELELPRVRDELGIDATFSKPFSPSAVATALYAPGTSPRRAARPTVSVAAEAARGPWTSTRAPAAGPPSGRSTVTVASRPRVPASSPGVPRSSPKASPAVSRASPARSPAPASRAVRAPSRGAAGSLPSR